MRWLMQSGRIWFGAAAVVGVLLLPRATGAVDLLAEVAESQARIQCRDELSADVLALWFEFLPAESRVLIGDPVVRKAATPGVANTSRGMLRAAGMRIYVAQAAKQGRIDRNATLSRVSELQREFRGRTFPMSLEQALRTDTFEARAYIEAAASAIRPPPALPFRDLRSALPTARLRDIERPPAFSACGETFRLYLIGVDERVAFVPTQVLKLGGVDPVLQQIDPGTDVIAFRAPTDGCKRTPAGSAFFDRQQNGRLAGTYSSLGFPEVVQLSFSTASNHAWACSGILLDQKWVLTAAHCTDDDGAATGQSIDVWVMLSDSVAKTRKANGMPIWATTVGAPIIHEAYLDAVRLRLPQVNKGASDLALFQLLTPLGTGSAPGKDTARAPNRVLGTLAGFGATLLKPSAGVANAPLDVGWLRLAVTPSLVSWEPVGDQAPARNASCPGDSGAPIFMALAGDEPASEEPAIGCIAEKRELIGLVSFGQTRDGRSCVLGSSGAGPRLHPHLPWICQKTGLMCN